MNITLQFNALAEQVNRSLAIIAKRSLNKDGNPAYSNITLSTAEQPLLYDYFRDAVVYLTTETQYFVVDSTVTNDGEAPAVVLRFPDNHNTTMNTSLLLAVTTFCVAYALWAWFSVTEPKLVERYQQELRDKLNAIIQLIWHKAPPQMEYNYNLPPTVNDPGDITMADGEQRLFSYTLGSDGIDDLTIVSSNAEVIVSKNATNRLFSIYVHRAAGATANAVATITVKRGESDVLASFKVTALPASSGATTQDPVILGYAALSDHITLKEHQTVLIQHTGEITRMETSDDDVAIASYMGDGAFEVAANYEGSCVITLYGPNGWKYLLYVDVEVVKSTSPVINAVSPVVVKQGATLEITYTLGSDNIDDLVFTRGSEILTFTKDAANHKFVISGVTAGSTDCSITSAAHPESNKGFRVVVTAASQDVSPVIYGYSNGDQANMTFGDDPLAIEYYPGSRGSMVITCDGANAPKLEYDGSVLFVTPRAVGSHMIEFVNTEMNFRFILFLFVTEGVGTETPTLHYFFDKNITHSYELTDDSVDIETAKTIRVHIMDYSDDSLLTASSSNPAKVSVERLSVGYYLITPISGKATVTFTYGSWKKQMKITAANEEPETPEVEELTPPVIQPAGYDEQLHTMNVGDVISWSYKYEGGNYATIPHLTVEQIALGDAWVDGRYVKFAAKRVGTTSETIVVKSPDSPSWRSMIPVKVVEPANPSVSDGNYNRTVKVGGVDTFSIANGTIDMSTNYVETSSEDGGNVVCYADSLTNVRVYGSAVGHVEITLILTNGRTLTVNYTITEAEAEPGDPGGGSEPAISDGNYSRTVEVGKTDTFTINGATVTDIDTSNSNGSISASRNGNTITVTGISASSEARLSVFYDGNMSNPITVTYTVTAAGGNVDPGNTLVTNGEERTLTYGNEEIIYVDGVIKYQSSDDPWTVDDVAKVGNNGVKVRATGVGETDFTIVLSDNSHMVIRYTVNAKNVGTTPIVENLSRTTTVGGTDTISAVGGQIDDVHTDGDPVGVSVVINNGVVNVTGTIKTTTTNVYVITNAGTKFTVNYKVNNAGTPPWIDGTDHLQEDTRTMVSDVSEDIITVKNGYITGVESTDDSIISLYGYDASVGGINMHPHAAGTADVTIHTEEGYDLVVHYNITQAPVRPTSTVETEGFDNGARGINLQLGQKAVVTIHNGTLVGISQAYVGGGGNNNLFEFSRNGNVGTVKAIGLGSNIVYFQTAEETSGSGSHVLMYSIVVDGPEAPDGTYRDICQGGTDTITVEGAKITSFQSSNDNALSVEKISDDTLKVTGVSGSTSGTSVAVTMVCNDWPANTFTVNYKVWPAADPVTLPDNVSRIRTLQGWNWSEFANKRNNEHVEDVLIVICVKVPMHANLAETTYEQEYPMVQLSWDSSLNRYVLKNIAVYDSQAAMYCYYTGTSAGNTLAKENAETSQLIYEVACVALQRYGFTGNNKPVLGETLKYAQGDNPWAKKYIIIPE